MFIPPSRTRRARERASLTQFVVLSMLVHLLVVVLFRQPPGVPGGRGDRSLLSTLEVVLQPPKREAAAEPNAPSRWRPSIGPPSEPRQPPRIDTPRREATASPSPQSDLRRPDAVVEPAPPVNDALPIIDRRAPMETDKLLARPAESAPVALPQPLAPFQIEPPRAIEREMPTAPTIAPAPPLPQQPLPRFVAPPLRAVTPAIPATPELPAPPPLPAEPLPRIDAPATRRFERELAPTPELPAPAPLPVQPMPHTEAPLARPIERDLPRAPELPAAAPLPAQSLPRIDVPPARAIERDVPPAPELAPATPLPSQSLSRMDAPPVRPLAPAPSLALPSPAARAPDIAPAPRGAADAPAGPRLFAPAVPLIEPKPADTNGPPRFDFDRAREVARDFNRGRVTGRPVDFDSPPGERVTPLGRAIQKAAQPDCREAYAALGLLGLIPLIADTVMDRGCRW